MKKIKEIYLTAGHEDESLVWCENRVTDEDVKYIRADILKSSLLSQKKDLKLKAQAIGTPDGYVNIEKLFDDTPDMDLKEVLEKL